jgi:Holliday junction DNA helicase RuvA
VISCVAGTVGHIGLDRVVLEVGGLGLSLLATPRTLAGLQLRTPARLAASLVVREDSLTLYGFRDEDERDVFETVQLVSGVGPRLALAMLAVHTPDQVRAAVADEDLATLCAVPGIGRKGAGRIVLELGDRLGAPRAASAASPAGRGQAEVADALVSLGWNTRQAADAVAAVSGDLPDADLAVVLRAALAWLGKT